MLRNQDKPTIAFVLQSVRKKKCVVNFCCCQFQMLSISNVSDVVNVVNLCCCQRDMLSISEARLKFLPVIAE